MPHVVSTHTKTLKLAAKVKLPAAVKNDKGGLDLTPVSVTKEQWAKCCQDKHTRMFMARGIVKLAAAPKTGAKASTTSSAPKSDAKSPSKSGKK